MIDRYPRGYPTDEEVLLRWKLGKNSRDIAKELWCPEYEVANRLPLILLHSKRDKEWNFDRTA